MAEDRSKKKPRVRKIETVRERNFKVAEKAEKKAGKVRLRRTRKLLATVAKPLGVFRVFKQPVSFITRPLRTRPAKFVGRWIGRILWPRYFRNSWKEVRQVTWPDRATTWKLTLAVLLFAIIFGLAAAGTDWVLDKIIRRIVFRG